MPAFRDASAAAAAAPPSAAVRSPWHSPVPYLFGGLAAMLGLIAFALLILACSYWKLSGDGERDLESGEAEGGEKAAPPPVMEEKFLVIMAGQEKPTFLATPVSSRTSSFGSSKCSCKGGSTVSSDGSTLSEADFAEKNVGNGGAADQVH